MTVSCTERCALHPDDFEMYNSAMLRENFNVGGLFKAGKNPDYDHMDKTHPADFTSQEN